MTIAHWGLKVKVRGQAQVFADVISPILVRFCRFLYEILPARTASVYVMVSRRHSATALPSTSTVVNRLCSFEPNGEWLVVGKSVQRREFHFKCCPNELFSNVAFSVALRRRHQFYVMNVVLPGGPVGLLHSC